MALSRHTGSDACARRLRAGQGVTPASVPVMVDAAGGGRRDNSRRVPSWLGGQPPRLGFACDACRFAAPGFVACWVVASSSSTRGLRPAPRLSLATGHAFSAPRLWRGLQAAIPKHQPAPPALSVRNPRAEARTTAVPCDRARIFGPTPVARPSGRDPQASASTSRLVRPQPGGLKPAPRLSPATGHALSAPRLWRGLQAAIPRHQPAPLALSTRNPRAEARVTVLNEKAGPASGSG